MTIQEAYNNWSAIYDTNQNKTRDLEAVALRHILKDKTFENILEIGCGTGKNTDWLHKTTQNLIGVDFSEEMLEKAKQKIKSENVQFIRADIQESLPFEDGTFDLVTCSLVLEHIDDLNGIFKQIRRVLTGNGLLCIGELHPFKQYLGTKAKFETAEGIYELTCFTHHVSDFYKAVSENGFECIDINEWFDNDDRGGVPRILTMVCKKPPLSIMAKKLKKEMKPVDVFTEITIARPIDVVATYAANPDNAPTWYVNIKSADWKTAKPLVIGSQIAFVAHFLGRKLAYVYEFVELKPLERLVMKTTDGPFPMETTYTWQAIDDNHTQMTMRNRGMPSGFSKIFAPFMSLAMKKANQKDLQKLKEILEKQ